MTSAFHEFMKGLIDYAGLFPPARLEMDRAIRNYAAYRTSPDAWMLSHFICPAVRLVELEPYREDIFSKGELFTFSVLPSGGETEKDFLENLQDDLNLIDRFLKENSGRVKVEMIEARLPVETYLQSGSGRINQFLQNFNTILSDSAIDKTQVFFEMSLGVNWQKDVPAVIRSISEFNRKYESARTSASPGIGFKLRCGGLEAAAFPAPDQVAFVLRNCREFEIPFKATAGLHHPLRHHDESIFTDMHGFLNVFGGALLSWEHNLTEQQIEEIIRDKEPQNFIFEKDSFAWKELKISAEKIARFREKYAISFGSCSFDEPRDDLRALGLLPQN